VTFSLGTPRPLTTYTPVSDRATRNLPNPIPICMDEHTKRRESLARSRHIERRYLKMQEWVAEGKIKVKYINTDENRADMFTKPLDRATFEKHASGIMGW